jgi:hypothetical protein
MLASTRHTPASLLLQRACLDAQERGFFSNTAKKINRHAIASLKSGQLAGILVSSVNLALEDLAAVKLEAIRSGLGLAPNVAASTKPMAFLDAEVSGAERKNKTSRASFCFCFESKAYLSKMKKKKGWLFEALV